MLELELWLHMPLLSLNMVYSLPVSSVQFSSHFATSHMILTGIHTSFFVYDLLHFTFATSVISVIQLR